jgi:hypothetical protein
MATHHLPPRISSLLSARLAWSPWELAGETAAARTFSTTIAAHKMNLKRAANYAEKQNPKRAKYVAPGRAMAETPSEVLGQSQIALLLPRTF